MLFKYELLPQKARWLARIPRVNKLIGRLPERSFSLLKTAADVYWDVYTRFDRGADIELTGLFDQGMWGRTPAIDQNPSSHRLHPSLMGWSKSRGDTPNREDEDIREWQVRLATALTGAVAFEMFLGGRS